MLALISDIHSNIEALSAVLEDIASQGVEKIYCLGDVVGYGPDPQACLDTVMERCADMILGNHDYATLYEPTNFNIGAENAVFWTRARLEQDGEVQVRRRWEYLGTREVVLHLDGGGLGCREVMLAHGSPRRPINEYIFPDDMYNSPTKLSASLERFEHLCFVGHTHVPGVFTAGLDFHSPADLDGEYEITEGKALINVGSVGQPRDRDPRAGYVLLRDGKVIFRRVAYDVPTTMNKVYAIQELDDYLGARLEDGR